MKSFFFGVLFTTVLFSCASAKKIWIPGNPEQLTLLIDQDRPGLMYPHCGGYSMFKKNCKDKGVKRWDLNDPVVRKQFKYFVCKHESREW